MAASTQLAQGVTEIARSTLVTERSFEAVPAHTLSGVLITAPIVHARSGALALLAGAVVVARGTYVTSLSLEVVLADTAAGKWVSPTGVSLCSSYVTITGYDFPRRLVLGTSVVRCIRNRITLWEIRISFRAGSAVLACIVRFTVTSSRKVLTISTHKLKVTDTALTSVRRVGGMVR